MSRTRAVQIDDLLQESLGDMSSVGTTVGELAVALAEFADLAYLRLRSEVAREAARGGAIEVIESLHLVPDAARLVDAAWADTRRAVARG